MKYRNSKPPTTKEASNIKFKSHLHLLTRRRAKRFSDYNTMPHSGPR